MIGSYIFPGVERGRPRYPGATNRLPLLVGQRRTPEQRSLSWPSAAIGFHSCGPNRPVWNSKPRTPVPGN